MSGVTRVAALTPLVAILALAAAGQEPPTFATRIDAIRLDVLVTDRDRIVRGLDASSFEVRDNGVVQDVELVSSEGLPLNVILALDTSGSVAGEPLVHLSAAAGALLERLEPDDRAGLITFSHDVTLREGLTTDLDRVRRALAAVEPEGETAVIDASYVAMMVGESDVGRDLLIVFTDGVDTSSWLTESRVLSAARRSDVVVYGVSVRGTEAPDFLGRLCQFSGGSLFEVESTSDLRATFLRIFDEFRSRYLLSYTPRGVSPEGWHRIEVKVNGHRGWANVRAGYMGGARR